MTEFQDNLVALIEKALEGESIEVLHHGKTIRLVVVEGRVSKLDRLIPRPTINPDSSDDEALERKLKKEIFDAIEEDWKDL